MARSEINRSGEMEVFIRVVEQGGFTAAAKALSMTPSAVSKLVARLEARLGSRLINRSTRKLQLTAEGLSFHERALRVLADLDEAERSVSACAVPRGRLRVNSSVPFGVHHLLPLVPKFTALHPEVQLDVTITDQVIDLMDERAEVAIRIGPLRSSQLMARKLGRSRMVVVASPDYLARRGTPARPEDLAGHDLITFNFARHINTWPFEVPGEVPGEVGGEAVQFPAQGKVTVGDGESAAILALAGQGLTRLSIFHIAQDIQAGRLVPVLEAFNPGDAEDVSAVYVGHAGPLPARVRAFIDFLVAEVDVDHPPLK
jgi:DNA-binding transcriptional LysR family regulator